MVIIIWFLCHDYGARFILQPLSETLSCELARVAYLLACSISRSDQLAISVACIRVVTSVPRACLADYRQSVVLPQYTCRQNETTMAAREIHML